MKPKGNTVLLNFIRNLKRAVTEHEVMVAERNMTLLATGYPLGLIDVVKVLVE
jgi:hypothetical protein